MIKYSIFLIFVQAAANVLGIPQLTEIINSITLYIPNVIVAMAIIVVGTFIAQFLAGLVRSSISELGVGRFRMNFTETQGKRKHTEEQKMKFLKNNTKQNKNFDTAIFRVFGVLAVMMSSILFMTSCAKSSEEIADMKGGVTAQ